MDSNLPGPGRAGLGAFRIRRYRQVVFDFETGDLQGGRSWIGQFSKLLSNREFESTSGEVLKQGTYYLSTTWKAG